MEGKSSFLTGEVSHLIPNTWIVDIDLERFFDTVNHDKLMNIISRIIKDGDVISLLVFTVHLLFILEIQMLYNQP